MAEKKYEPKAKVSSIKATSRSSIKIKDNFFTIEYTEERVIPDLDGIDIEEERIALWDAVNNEVDNQAEIIYNTFNNRS